MGQRRLLGNHNLLLLVLLFRLGGILLLSALVPRLIHLDPQTKVLLLHIISHNGTRVHHPNRWLTLILVFLRPKNPLEVSAALSSLKKVSVNGNCVLQLHTVLAWVRTLSW